VNPGEFISPGTSLEDLCKAVQIEIDNLAKKFIDGKS
jgi:hypothetical protein